MAIRPESILLGDPDSSSALVGTIDKAAYLGGHLEYQVSTPVGDLFVIDPRVELARTVGASVAVGFGSKVALIPDTGDGAA